MDEIRRRSSKIPLMRLSHEGDRIDGVGERGLKKDRGIGPRYRRSAYIGDRNPKYSRSGDRMVAVIATLV